MTAPRTAVLVDVDGVINAHSSRPGDTDHWPWDTWRREPIRDDEYMWGVHVHWSTAVVDGLRRIEQTPGVPMLWCTTWEACAAAVLASLTGIGAKWPHLDEIQRDPSGRWFNWWKATRAWEALPQYDQVVWIDDDIAAWSNILTMPEQDEDWQRARDERMWWVCPQTRRGLEASHFAEIDNFLAGPDPWEAPHG